MYIHLLLHIRPTTPRANACRSILVQGGRTRRSWEKPVTGEWCESPRTSRLQLWPSTRDKNTTSTPCTGPRWTSGTSAAWISIWSVWAGSSCPFILTVRCAAPRSFARRSFWRTNTVSSTSKTMTRNVSFGACCRRYTQPLITHNVCRSINVYEHSLKVEGLNFPVQTKQIAFFEKLNPSISVNVLAFEESSRGSRWNIAAPNANENTTWTSCISKTPTIPPNDITFRSKTRPHSFVTEPINNMQHSSAILVTFWRVD